MVISGDVVFWQVNSEEKKKKNQTFLTGEEVKSCFTEGIILPNGREQKWLQAFLLGHVALGAAHSAKHWAIQSNYSSADLPRGARTPADTSNGMEATQ